MRDVLQGGRTVRRSHTDGSQGKVGDLNRERRLGRQSAIIFHGVGKGILASKGL